MVQNMMNLKTFYKKLSNSSKNEFDGTAFVLELANTDKRENIERIESLCDGDELRLDFVRLEDKIIAKVYNKDNEEIGCLSSYTDYIWELGRSGELEIDRIEAYGVVPISKRKKGSKKAIVFAKFYLSESCYMKPVAFYEEEFDSETGVEELFDEDKLFDSNTDVEELFSDDMIDVKGIADAVNETVSKDTSNISVEAINDRISKEDNDVSYSEGYASEQFEKKLGEYVTLNDADVVLEGVTPAESSTEDVVEEHPSVEDDEPKVNNVPYSAPVYSHNEEELIDSREDRKQKYFYTQTFETIDSIKSEIRRVIDEGVWDTREALRMRTIDSHFMVDAMFKSLNILRARRITDYLFLNFIFDNVVTQYEVLSEALSKINSSCQAMAKEMAKNARNSELFVKGRRDIAGYIASDDQFLLKFAENLDKLWNSIPKNEQLQGIIERTFAVMALIYETSESRIVLKDISGEVVDNFQYVSATILKDYYEKWASVYEYLPFIKAKKKAFYESELETVNNEISEIKKHYEELKYEKSSRMKVVHDEIEDYENKLSSMGIFSFGSKKSFREKIDELVKEEEQLRKDIDSINAEYNVKIGEPVVRAEAIKSKITWYSAD